MVHETLFIFTSFYNNLAVNTVTFYFTNISEFVSLLLLLFILNGLVVKERVYLE